MMVLFVDRSVQHLQQLVETDIQRRVSVDDTLIRASGGNAGGYGTFYLPDHAKKRRD